MKQYKSFILECIQFLVENRIQFLKDKNPQIDTSHDANAIHSDSSAIIDHFATNADPTQKKVHTQWIIGQYKKKQIRQEDHPRIREALSNFDRYKSKLDKKDINQYSSVSEIEDAVNPHLGTAATKKEASSIRDTEGHKLVHSHTDAEGNRFDVYHLSDKKISQDVYGGGHSLGYPHTSWCTAARSENCMFGHYAHHGNLYTIHKTDPEGKKDVYQLHPYTEQFMNAKDEPVDVKDFPREVFEFNDAHMPKFRLNSGVSSKGELDKLVNDDDRGVRMVVVKYGHKEHLDKLVSDDDWGVRTEVAKYGHKEHLDKLVSDDDWGVRIEVAKHGHKEHLDKLVNDDYWIVRREVAKHGHKEHLDKLVDDDSPDVKTEVAIHGHKEHLDKLVNDDEPDVLVEVAKRGHKEHLDKLVNDIDPHVRKQVAIHGNKEHLDKLVNDDKWRVRAEVARHGHKEHLDKLVNDVKWGVRYEVAGHGHKEHLDKLVNDDDPDVRAEVAKKLSNRDDK